LVAADGFCLVAFCQHSLPYSYDIVADRVRSDRRAIEHGEYSQRSGGTPSLSPSRGYPGEGD
jgi:hypothetical protein